MGLDQYIYSVEAKILKPVDFLAWEDFVEWKDNAIKRKEIAYWRNNRAVQTWMKQLYIIKGGEDPDFNGNPVQLTEEDIIRFIRSAASNDWTDLIPRRDLQWVGEALSCIAEGKTVYYNSSW